MTPATDLDALAARLRRTVIDCAMAAGVGHIGSALSIVDLVAALYGRVLRIPDPDDGDRDRFILSKGHAALALYAALFERGFIDRDLLDSYCRDDTPARDAPRAPGAGNRLLDRVARPGSFDRRRRRARRPLTGLVTAGLHARQRRRMRRGLALGGGHVRCPTSALEPGGASST